jgi:hypothetical protein
MLPVDTPLEDGILYLQTLTVRVLIIVIVALHLDAVVLALVHRLIGADVRALHLLVPGGDQEAL